MPDANETPVNAPESPANWLSVAQAARRLEVSPRAIQKRCASGTLPARRVPGARGEVWEVSTQGLTVNPSANGEPVKANPSANVRRQVRADVPIPAPNQGEPQRERRTLESERERELKEEVRFLRGQLEDANRNAAEIRAALRDALKMAPKMLTAGESASRDQSARIEESDVQNHATNKVVDDVVNGPQNGVLSELDEALRAFVEASG